MMPLGIRCSAVFTPLITSVWPALWPPWKRTTPWAISVSQSTSLPLPSSPHWVPTTTTLRPVVLFMEKLGKKNLEGFNCPGAAGVHQLAVALELVEFAVVAGKHADHGFAALAQRRDRSAQAGGFAPGRADRSLERTPRSDADQLLEIEAEADRRPVAAEHRADFVIAAAAHQRIG